jgi:hypothetical protein
MARGGTSTGGTTMARGSRATGGTTTVTGGTTTVTGGTTTGGTMTERGRKRQQQHHHQRTNRSTIMRTFTSPGTWTYLNLGKIGIISHPGHFFNFYTTPSIAKFLYHTLNSSVLISHFVIELLKYHFFFEALVKYTYIVFEAVILTHVVLFTIYIITLMHPW